MSYLYTMLNADANEVSTRFEHVRSELASENEETRPDVVSSSLDVSTSNVLEDEVTEGDIQFLHNLDVVGVERMMKMKLPYGYSMQALDPKLVAGGIVALLGLVGLGFLAKRMEWFKSDSDKNSDAGSKGSDSIDKADKSVSSSSSDSKGIASLLGEFNTLYANKRFLAVDLIIQKKAVNPKDTRDIFQHISQDMAKIQNMIFQISPVMQELKGISRSIGSQVGADDLNGLNTTVSSMQSKIKDTETALQFKDSSSISNILNVLTGGGEYDLKTESSTDGSTSENLRVFKEIRAELINIKNKLQETIKEGKLPVLELQQINTIKADLPTMDDGIKLVHTSTTKASKVLDPLAEMASKLSNELKDLGDDEANAAAVKELKESFKNVGENIKIVVAIVEIYTVIYQITMLFVIRMAALGALSTYIQGLRAKTASADAQFEAELKKNNAQAANIFAAIKGNTIP